MIARLFVYARFLQDRLGGNRVTDVCKISDHSIYTSEMAHEIRIKLTYERQRTEWMLPLMGLAPECGK